MEGKPCSKCHRSDVLFRKSDTICKSCRDAYAQANKDKARARDIRYRKRKKLGRAWKVIPHEKMRKIVQFSHKYAHKWGIHHLAEDIAQEIIITKSQGSYREWIQIAIDYVRSVYGRTDGGAVTDPILNGVELEVLDKEVSEDGFEDSLDIMTVLKRLYPANNDKSRVMFLLYFVYGLNHHEIGALYGVSNMRACQIIRSVEENVKEELKKTPLRKAKN